MSGPPGAPTERTVLAWQRTALSIAAAAALMSRLTFDRLGVFALTGLLVALPLSLWVFWEFRFRHAPAAAGGRRLAGGTTPAALALATGALALLELVALLS